MIGRRILIGALFIALVSVIAAGFFSWPENTRKSIQPELDLPELGLMATLPIYWGEVSEMEEVLNGSARPHWARAVLERENILVPLDSLADQDGAGRLRMLDRLMLAQPRALSPPENVALDDWVTRGGRLLLFADPLLTGHSRFAISDRRRPQDVVLLSPILTRWGLSLHFDEGQTPGERVVGVGAADIPVNLAGTLKVITPMPGASPQCTVLGGGLAAQCAIGKGSALIIADAALLDMDGAGHRRKEALLALTNRAFAGP